MKSLQTPFAFAALISLWSGYANAAPATSSSLCVTAKYDNVTGENVLPVPSDFVYENLYYTNWIIGPAPSTGVQPKSTPNYNAFRVIDNMPHTISTNFTHSAYSTFDLEEFYFGCNTVTGESVVDATSNCDLAVYGVYADGSMTTVLTYGFFSDNPVAGPMLRAVAPLLGVKTVYFGVSASESTPDTTVAIIDNLSYCLHR